MRERVATTSGPAVPRWTAGLLIWGLWSAVGLASAGASWANWVNEKFPVTLGRAMLLLLPYWLFWAVVTPAIVALERRWPASRRHAWRSSLLHGIAALACAVVHEVLQVAINKAWFPWPPSEAPSGPAWGPFLTSQLYTRWQFDVLIYAAILGAVLALRYYREAEQRAVVAAQLEAQLAQAQLAALQMQLNPHFLFNTLQAISTLTLTDPKSAQRMLTRLGDLLRAVLEGGDRQEIPLSEELTFLKGYLEIEEARFPDRLSVTYDIATEAMPSLVPSFILQPLVENAIRHGIAPRSDHGHIALGARVTDGELLLRVSNDGTLPPAVVREGIGLSTTRARLARLYGDTQELTLGVVDGRTEVMISIPYHQSLPPSPQPPAPRHGA